ncbi:class I adenylate cyclase [Spirochaetota bacterium]
MSFNEIIGKNKQNFLNYNGQKYKIFQDLFINANIKRAVNSIPLLLSVNEKKLPGYVDGDVPLGITGYEPDEEIIKFITGKFHTSSINCNFKDPHIELLAIMGSIGTIAYNKDSDYDYWVCINKSRTGPKMIANLSKKIDSIQKWIKDEFKLEVHLFINDIENIKKNIYAEDENEAYGSTIGATLKDEFFRSSIIIAGKIPFWWVIPRLLRDSEYHKLYQQLDDAQEKEFIDFGNLHDISKEDFLGAALFQLIKSLENPYKSLLKLGVLERYLFGTESSLLLSQKVKLNIHRGQITRNILDPYILMFQDVYNYYETVLEDKKMLEILRQNLYLKINPQLSKYLGIQHSKNLPYKVIVMLDYVNNWGWKKSDLRELDNFNNWDYFKIMQYWNMVKKFMLLSYQKISKEFPSVNLMNKISESDFKLLKRKIQTYFSTSDGKIDKYITFKDTPHESILYYEPVNKGIKEVEWKLNKRDAGSKDEFAFTTIKVDEDLVKLLCWTSINKIFDPTFSRVKIKSGYSRIDQNQVTMLLTTIHNLFVEKEIHLKNEFFLKSSYRIANMIIINFNSEKAESISSIYYIYRTSWGESFIKKHTTEIDLIQILKNVLESGLKTNSNYDDFCKILTPEPFRKIYKNIEVVFKESYEFLVNNKSKKSLCLATQIGDKYLLFYRNNNDINLSIQQNPVRLLSEITMNPKKNIAYNFHGDNKRIQIMAQIYKKKKENSISIFYEENKNYLIIYVINEMGNIFTFMKPINQKQNVLIYLYDFSTKIIESIKNQNYLPNINEKIALVKFHQDKFDKYSFINETHLIEGLHLKHYKPESGISALISKHSGVEAIYSIKLADKKAIKKLPLNQMQEKLGTLNVSPGQFSLINEIEFDDLEEEDYELGSTIYFLEKYRLELIIDKTSNSKK